MFSKYKSYKAFFYGLCDAFLLVDLSYLITMSNIMGKKTPTLMVGTEEVVLKPVNLAKMNKYKRLKPKVTEGKETEPKNSGIAIEATKTKPN